MPTDENPHPRDAATTLTTLKPKEPLLPDALMHAQPPYFSIIPGPQLFMPCPAKATPDIDGTPSVPNIKELLNNKFFTIGSTDIGEDFIECMLSFNPETIAAIQYGQSKSMDCMGLRGLKKKLRTVFTAILDQQLKGAGFDAITTCRSISISSDEAKSMIYIGIKCAHKQIHQESGSSININFLFLCFTQISHDTYQLKKDNAPSPKRKAGIDSSSYPDDNAHRPRVGKN